MTDRKRVDLLRAVTPPPLTDPKIRTYRVQGGAPDEEAIWTVDLIATSEQAAISRTRGTMFYRLRNVHVFDWEWVVITSVPGVNFDGLDD